MKNKFLAVTIVFLSFCSSKTFGQTPLEFNNQMSEIADSLLQKGTDWGKQLSEIAKTTKQFEKLAPVRQSLEKYIFDQTARLRDMKDISGSYNFRQAMVSYLHFEKQLVDSLITPFEYLKPDSSDEIFKQTVDKLVKGASKEKEYLDQVHLVQNEYAKENNFTITQPDKN